MKKLIIDGKKYEIDLAIETLIEKKAGEPLAVLLHNLDKTRTRHHRISRFGFWCGPLIILTIPTVSILIHNNKLGELIGVCFVAFLFLSALILIGLTKKIGKEKERLQKRLSDLFDGLSCLVRRRPDSSGETVFHLNLRDIKLGILLEAQDIRWLERDYKSLDSNSPAKHILISARDDQSQLLARMLTAARELGLVISRECVFDLLSGSTPIGAAICPHTIDRLVFSGESEFFHL